MRAYYSQAVIDAIRAASSRRWTMGVLVEQTGPYDLSIGCDGVTSVSEVTNGVIKTFDGMLQLLFPRRIGRQQQYKGLRSSIGDI